MTRSFDDELRGRQHEIQRLFGQCLLLLQAYEGAMKAILANHDISWSDQTLDKVQDSRVANLGGKTLGTLVNHLLETFLTNDVKARSAKALPDPPENGPGCSIRARFQLGLLNDDLARVENGLRELVLLRNKLVHHFLEQHDLESLDGCQRADDALLVASGRIKSHYDELRQWAEELERIRLQAAEYFKSDASLDHFVGGVIPWRITMIVGALRGAATELAVDGWTPVAKADEWISAKYPEELPQNYGCRSWPQVLQESRYFEVSYRQTDGQRAAWYRVASDDLSSYKLRSGGG